MKKGGIVPIAVLVVIALVLTLSLVDKPTSPTGLQTAEINEAPRFIGGPLNVTGSLSIDLRDYFVDAESEVLSFAVDDSAVSMSGFMLAFTAPPNFVGEYVVNVQVSDGTNTVYKPLSFIVEGMVVKSSPLRGQLESEQAAVQPVAEQVEPVLTIQPSNDSGEAAPEDLELIIGPAISEITISAVPTQDDPVLNSTGGSGVSVNTSGMNETLTVYAQNVADGDGDSVQNITDWRVNGTSLAVLNMPFETNETTVTSGAIRDYSSVMNNGTLGVGVGVQVPSWNLSGKVGAAYTFDGVDDAIDVPNSSSLEFGTGDFSVCAWMRTSGLNGGIVTKRNDTTDPYLGWYLRISGGVSEFDIYDSSDPYPSNTFGVFSYVNVTDGAWHFLCGVADRDFNASIYVDGVLRNSSSILGSAGSVSSNSSLVIGNQVNNNFPFNGSVDEVLVLNRTLSAEQVYQLFLDGSQGNHSHSWLGSSFNRTDIVGVAVTPNDNSSDGVTKFTNNVTIRNAAPVIGQVILNSTDGSGALSNTASVNETLTVYAQNVADGDGDSVQNITDWRVNGTSLAVLNMPFETNETTSSAGAVQDYSSFVRNGTLVNGPLWSVMGKVGGAYSFDGVDDYVSVPSPTAFGGVVSVSAWIRSSAFVNGDGLGYGVSPDAGPSSYGWLMHPNAAGTVSFIVSNGSANAQAISTSTLENDQWQHIAGTYDGAFVRFYVNGTLQASVAMSGDINDAGGSVIELGKDVRYAAGRFLAGSLDEILVFNRSLSAAQIQQLYLDGSQGNHSHSWLGSSFNRTDIVGVAVTPNDNTSDGATKFTNNATIVNAGPSIAQVILNSTDGSGESANTSAPGENLTVVIVDASDVDSDAVQNITDWRLNGTSIAVLNMPFETNSSSTATGAIRDYSLNVMNGTLGSGIASQAPVWNASGKVGGAYTFDGANDLINLSDPSAVDFGAGDFAVEAWVLRRALGADHMIVGKDDAGAGRRQFLMFFQSTNTLRLTYFTAGDTTVNLVSSSTFTDTSNYHHIVMQRRGSTFDLFYDGVLNESGTSGTHGVMQSTTAPLLIGRRGFTGVFNPFNGSIDEVRIYNRSLSASQVAQLYADGLAGRHSETLVSSMLSAGQNWSVAVTPNDNAPNTDGVTVLSNNVTIQNAAQVVSLNSPVANYSVDVSATVPFNCSFSSDDSFTNVSLYHSMNGTFALRESANISGNGSYQFNVSQESVLGNLTKVDRSVLWNCQVCTSSACSFNESNATVGPWDLGSYANVSHYPANFSISLTRNGSNQYENLTGAYTSRIFSIPGKVLARRISWNGTAQSLFRNNTNFESDTVGSCPSGWSCSSVAAEVASSTDGQGCTIATGISGTKYIKAGCDADRANLTSDNFVLPLNISRIQFLRAGGADSPSGFFVQRVRDNATLCSAVYGANTDTFAADNCTGLAPYGGELVRIFINDLQTGAFGKVYVDRIMLQDSLNGNLTPLSSGNISFMFRGCTLSDCSDNALSGNYTNGTASTLSTAPGNYFQYRMNVTADNDVFSPFLDTRSITISYVPVGTFYKPNDAFTQTYDVNGTVNTTITNNTFYEFDQYITLNHSTFGRRVRFYARFNTSDVDLRNLTINATINATAVSIGSGLLGVDFGFSMFVPNLGQGVTVCPNATLVANTNITCPNAVGFTHNDALINNSREGYSITIEDGDYRVDNIFSTGLAQGASTNLTIYDDTNDFPLGANASRYLTDVVGFYANFTKGSVPANTTDGACQIQFNVSGTLGPVIDMTYASGPRVFVRNQTFAEFGTFYYNVTCSDAGDTLNTSDDFIIQSPVQFTSRNYTFNLSREDGETARLVIRNFASYFVDNITGNVTSLGVLLPSGFLGALHPDIALDLPASQLYNATVGLTLSLSNESNYTFNASINSVLFNVTLDTVPVTINLPTINETNYNFSVTPSSHTFVINDQTNAAQVCSDTSVVLTATNTGSQNITTFNMTRSGALPIRVVPDSIVDYVLPVGGSFNVTVYALVNETTPTSSVTMNFTIGSVTRTVALSYTNTGLAGWAALPVANSTTVSFGPTLTGKCANGLGFTGSITIPEPYDLGAITTARLVTTFGESTCPEGYATFADLFVNGNLVIDDERPFGSASGTITPATLVRSNNISMTSGPAGGHWCASGASSIQATFSNTATTYCAACSPSGDVEENFTDAVDNDCDSLTDCDDSDSCGAAACAGAGGLHAYFCPPEEVCSNGVDDNQNGLTDCQDVSLCCSASACAGSTGCANLQPNICDYGNYNTLCVIQTNKTVSDLITELRMNDFTVRGPRTTVNIGQFRLNSTGDVSLESGVVMNGRGRGYGANLGPGAPSSHGGGAELYDSPFSPNDMGSGSANSAGGGLFRAIVGGRFTNDGAIDTNGTTAASIGSSGAAGGGIFVNASEVYGTGRYYAPGGGPQAGGTAGGGGRIAIWANNAETINRSRFNVTAPGNPSRSGTGVLVDKDTQTLITLEKFNFETIDGTYFPYNVSASGSLLGSNSSISVNGSFFVLSNSTLAQFGNVFNFTVYSDEMTISSASVISGSEGGGGGTSGSHGGAGEGGLAAIHGSALAPRDFGHSADGNPGAGSFAFIGDRFVNNGTITMLGDFSGVIANSGGAGGSIFVNASNVSGTGVFHARGGSGGSGGTGGGGGRIAVWGNNVSGFSHGQFNVSGGGGGTAGGAGTVILVDADDGQYFVVQNFRFESVDFPTGVVSVPRLVVENATLRIHTNGTSVLNISSLDFDRSVLMTEAASRMNVTVLMSEMNFTGNSSFVGNGKGYPNGQGPGVGANGGVGPTHGGQGTGNPQIFVGSALVPSDFGSGGTVGFGGALFRIFGDSLVIEGLINLNATGTGVSSNSGGSGGAFLVNVSNFSSTAYIDARGAGGGAAGGSGGGGKIAILADNLGLVNLSRLNAVGALTTTEANGTVIVIDRDDGIYYLGHAFRFQSTDFAQGLVNVTELVANSSLVRFAVNTTINSSGNVSFLNSHVFGNTNDRLIVLGDVIALNGSLVNVPFLDFRFDDSLIDNTSTRYRSSLSSLRLERVNVSAVNYSAATTNVHNLSRNIVLQQNLVRVNSSNVSGLNRSANITLYNITTPGAPLLMVDDADTGNFVACPSSRCTLQSYSGGVVLFNVSRFTSYSSSEGIFLEKNDSPDPVPAGSTLTYTLFINNSDGNIENLTLTETYPVQVTFNGSEPTPNVSNNTFFLPNLATNQTYQVNITVNVSSALIAGFIINNTANLTFNNASGSSFFVNVTESTTVANAGPSIQEVILNSTDGSGEASAVAADNENLTVIVVNATDPDGQQVQNITDWRVNGTSIAVLNLPFETNTTSAVVGAVRDYSTHGNNATLSVAPVWNASGRAGGAYSFDGVNDYMNATSNVLLGTTGPFTAMAWIRPNTQAVSQTVFTKDQRAGANNRRMFQVQITAGADIISGSTIAGYIWDESASAFLGEASSVTLTDAWHHVAFVYDGGTAQSSVQLYIDGIDQSIVYSGGAFAGIDDTTADFLIGSYINAGGALDRRFSGTIDEILVFNRSLSASQISQIVQDQNSSKHMLTLVDNETGISDVWSVAVTPNDNAPNTDGATVLSNNVTISAEGNVTNLNTSEQFVTIQQAVDDAQTLNGHVINVSAGTYTENVVVNKQLTIQGEGPTVTFVRSAVNASPVFNISNIANVQITGFTISNASGASRTGSGIFIENASFVNVLNNEITSNTDGVALLTLNDSRVENNTIRNNSEGMGMEFGRNITFANNTIADHPSDSGLWFGDSVNVTVANSTFVNNTGTTFDAAVLVYSVDLLSINGNEFHDNIYGILVTGTNNTDIFNNMINASDVADLQVDTSANATVENITILSQGLSGVIIDNVSGSFVNVSVTLQGAAIGMNISNTGDLLLNRTRLVGAENWFTSSGASWTLQNTTFETAQGAINTVLSVSVSGLQNVTSAKLNVTLNHSVLNSTNLSFLNTSAQITLNGLTFVDPRPLVDFEDDGAFTECNPPQCVEISFAGGIYVFNVSSFTSYAAQENLTFVINLSVDKFDSPDPVPRGSQLSYQIQINNTGNASAVNVTLVETYPPDVSFVSSQPVPSAGNNTFSIGNLSNGSSFLVNITVNVSSAIANGTLLNNSVQVIFTNSSGVNSTVNESEITTVLGAPVVVSIKSDSPDPVVKGAQLNYSILINNTGDDTAFNVTLSELYPGGVSFVSSSPAPSAGNGTFNIGALAPGVETTVNITVVVGSNIANGTILNNSVNLSFRNLAGSQSSASDSELTTVLGFPVLAVTKTDSPDPVNNGSTLSYTITITNSGDEVAYNVTAAEGFDANVTFNGSAPVPTLGNNTFAVGNLSPGQSVTINLTVNVSPAAIGVLNNTVNVSSENLSGVVSVASAFAETTVSAAAPPAPTGGGGSGGGGGAAFTRNTPITRNETVAPLPVSFPFAEFPPRSEAPSVVVAPVEELVSGQVEVVELSKTSSSDVLATEKDDFAFVWTDVSLKGIGGALLALLAVGLVAAAFTHRSNERGPVVPRVVPKLKEPSALAFSQLNRAVARERALLKQGISSISEKFPDLPKVVPVAVQKPLPPEIPKQQVVVPSKFMPAHQVLPPKLVPAALLPLKKVQIPAIVPRPAFSRFFKKAVREPQVRLAAVPVQKNKSVDRVSSEIDKLHRELARSLKLLEKGKESSRVEFNLPAPKKPRVSWWSRAMKPKEKPNVSVSKTARAVAVPRPKMKPICKVPSAGTRDSLRELKKSKQELRKVASFVRKVKRAKKTRGSH